MKRLICTLLLLATMGCSSDTPTQPTVQATTSVVFGLDVIVNNNFDNAVAEDISFNIWINNQIWSTVQGNSTRVTQTVKLPLQGQYRINSANRPDTYSSTECFGSVNGNPVNCTITLSDKYVPPGCDDSLIAFIYRPARLQFGPCVTVAGRVELVEDETDGDGEFLLKPFDKYKDILTSGNNARNGLLIVESICRGDVSQEEADALCKKYRDSYTGIAKDMPWPEVGQCLVTTGRQALDLGHRFPAGPSVVPWAEIHPLTKWKLCAHQQP